MCDKTTEFHEKVVRTLEELGTDHFQLPAKLCEHGDAYALRSEDTRWILVIRVANEASALAEASAALESEDPPDRVILVTTKSTLSKRRPPEIAVFEERELMYNAMRHADSPPMRKTTDEERSALLSKLGIVDTNLLPAMLPSDVAARYYGFGIGDVVKSLRMTSSGPTTYYRIVRF